MRRALLAWMVIASAAAAPAAGEEAGAPFVRLLPEAGVSTEHLRLDQIAAPGSALPDGRPLSGIYLGRSAPAGEIRVVRAADARAALRKAGLEVPVEGESRVLRLDERPEGARTVWTAARDLRKGRVLSEKDLAERKALPGERVAGAPPREELLGRELSRDLAGGAILCGSDVRAPVSVRKGDLVRVSTDVQGAGVSFWARSLADARCGEAVEMDLPARPGCRVRAVVRGPTEARLAGD